MFPRLRFLAIRNYSIALLIAALICFLSFALAWHSIQNAVNQQYANDVSDVGERVAQYLSESVSVLDGLVTLFLSSPYADESSFRVVSERFTEHAPFLVSTAYFHLVKGDQRSRFEKDMALNGYAGFKIRNYNIKGGYTAKTRERYLPLIYIEPRSVDQVRYLGFDIETDLQLRYTLREAIRYNTARGIFLETGLTSIGRYWLFKPLFADSPHGSSRHLNGVVAVALDFDVMSKQIDLPENLAVSFSNNVSNAQESTSNEMTDWGIHLSQTRQIGNPIHPLSITFERFVPLQVLPATPLVLAALSSLLIGFLLIYLARTATLRTRWLMERHEEISQKAETSNQELQSAEEQLEISLNHLREEEEKYRSFIQSTSEGFWMIDQGLVTIEVNNALCRMLEFPREEILGRSIFDFVDDENHHILQRQTSRISDTPHRRYDINLLTKSGKSLPVIMAATTFSSLLNKAAYAFAFVTDISQRKNMEQELRLAANVFTHANEGIVITNSKAEIVDVNDAFTRITGYTREQSIGNNCRFLQSGHQSGDFYKNMWESLLSDGSWEGEIWNRRISGEVYAERLKISAVLDADNSVQYFVGLFSDITAQKNHLNQITQLAHYDALTQLPNRILFSDRLSQAMTQEQRRGLVIAIAYIDLDGFKAVNDKYGHAVGDQLLTVIAKRMHSVLREGDTLARFGGDEFVAMLIDLASDSDAVPLLERLCDIACEPAPIDGHQISVSASIGFTTYPQPQDIAKDELLRQADTAMYQAKLQGKNRCYQYDNNGPEKHRSSIES